mmetsp:Transcript_72239/g.221203  ORF Transcript_72239/g.221203 Transcript_72239/m.221203 type:complete len:394 (-) Transcript_72239:1849-3030(-)
MRSAQSWNTSSWAPGAKTASNTKSDVFAGGGSGGGSPARPALRCKAACAMAAPGRRWSSSCSTCTVHKSNLLTMARSPASSSFWLIGRTRHMTRIAPLMSSSMLWSLLRNCSALRRSAVSSMLRRRAVLMAAASVSFASFMDSLSSSPGSMPSCRSRLMARSASASKVSNCTDWASSRSACFASNLSASNNRASASVSSSSLSPAPSKSRRAARNSRTALARWSAMSAGSSKYPGGSASKSAQACLNLRRARSLRRFSSPMVSMAAASDHSDSGKPASWAAPMARFKMSVSQRRRASASSARASSFFFSMANASSASRHSSPLKLTARASSNAVVNASTVPKLTASRTRSWASFRASSTTRWSTPTSKASSNAFLTSVGAPVRAMSTKRDPTI